ncbi:MAG: glycoside hydrolase family 1 protein [Erysipelotrichaceae bacterium]
MKKSKVPETFYWGASTSAFQVEGGRHEGGKGIATTDVRNVPSGKADSSIASDHYHHYEEDILLMKELGINMYRFSFCWSRIMPDGVHVNPEGIAFYKNIVRLCKTHGIEPFPTLYHFEMPQALVDAYGGWKHRNCVDAFVSYATHCFHAFQDDISMWGTINEQLIATAAADLNGNKEGTMEEKMRYMYQMSYHMSLAEKLTIKAFRKIIPNGTIGPVVSMQVVYPMTPAPSDILAAKDAQDFLMHMFLDMSVEGRYPNRVIQYLKEKKLFPTMEAGDEEILKTYRPDLIGINYYASTCIRQKLETDDNSKLPPFYRNDLFILGKNNHIEKTKWMEFGIDPLGLYIGIRDIVERYQLPVIITENGLAYSDELVDGKVHDPYRIAYLEEHVNICYRLLEEGYPLLGYCPWSLLDLVSSHQGFSKRYGLIYVDRSDLDPKECKRIPKDSYYWYQNLIKQHKGGYHNE